MSLFFYWLESDYEVWADDEADFTTWGSSKDNLDARLDRVSNEGSTRLEVLSLIRFFDNLKHECLTSKTQHTLQILAQSPLRRKVEAVICSVKIQSRCKTMSSVTALCTTPPLRFLPKPVHPLRSVYTVEHIQCRFSAQIRVKKNMFMDL